MIFLDFSDAREMISVLDSLESFVAVDAGEDGHSAALGVLVQFGLFEGFLAVVAHK